MQFSNSTYQFPDESKIVNETHVKNSLIYCVQTNLFKQINIKRNKLFLKSLDITLITNNTKQNNKLQTDKDNMNMAMRKTRLDIVISHLLDRTILTFDRHIPHTKF